MTDKRIVSLTLKAIPLLLLTGAAALSPAAHAQDECGVGPTVVCTGSKAATGVLYNFNTNFSLTGGINNVGVTGMRLYGTGNANLFIELTAATVNGTGGVSAELENGHITAIISGGGSNNLPGGFRLAGNGGATVTLAANVPDSFPNPRLNTVSLDVGGTSTVDITKKRTVRVLELSPRAGGTMTVNNTGVIGDGATPVYDLVAVRGAGAGKLIINNAIPRGRLRGNFDLAASTGEFVLLNDNSFGARQGGWHAAGLNTFGSGKVEILNGSRGAIRILQDSLLDFSASSDSRILNEGRFMVGNGYSSGNTTLHIDGLDRFENEGLILLGTKFDVDTDAGLETSGKAHERLVMTGTDFIGGANSRIAVDARLAAVAQSDCSAVVSADCVLFNGGSTSGQTLVTVTDTNPLIEHAGFNAGMVLIDGSSAAEHFVLAADSQYYVPHSSAGPSLQKGLVAYHFSYDPAARQHSLIGTLADEGVQASTYSATAQEIWRTTAESWFDRQDTLRNDEGGGFNPHGFWTSLNVADTERDLQRKLSVAGNDVTYNVDQTALISHLAFGVDVLRITSGDLAWNLGATAGYVYTTVDYDATQLESTLAGFAGGLYSSLTAGALSADAMVNLNVLTQSINAKHLGLGKHARVRNGVESLGARLDLGWKLTASEHFWVQPLVSLAYINTRVEDIELEGSGSSLHFDDDRSARVGVGLRTAVDTRLLGARAQLMLTGRWWNDLAAENGSSAYIPNGNSTVTMVDDVSGSFAELATGLKLASESGALSGYVNLKSKFADDYSSLGAAAGVRWQW